MGAQALSTGPQSLLGHKAVILGTTGSPLVSWSCANTLSPFRVITIWSSLFVSSQTEGTSMPPQQYWQTQQDESEQSRKRSYRAEP